MSLLNNHGVLILVGCLALSCFCPANGLRKFPDNFLFGVSSASYQIEGAWNASELAGAESQFVDAKGKNVGSITVGMQLWHYTVFHDPAKHPQPWPYQTLKNVGGFKQIVDRTLSMFYFSGKGESIWDHLTHQKVDMIRDKSNGDVACDSYNNYKRDVEMVAELGVKVYRFSLSWSRLCPNGICIEFLKDGLDYYNNLIDELLKNGIQPAVTLFHWDLPQRLQDLGGWTNPILIQYFEWYANKSFQAFGDRVKMWLTFNEPRDVCLLGYGQTFNAPALDFYGIANYLCVGNLLKAHAKAYRLYDSQYRSQQKGRVGLTFSTHWYQPADETPESKTAAEIIRQFEAGIYANPIFGTEGDYPKIVKDLVAERSKEQGYPVSRLPPLDEESIQLIKGSSDFFGINHYTTKLAKMAPPEIKKSSVLSYEYDTGVIFFQDENWRGSSASWLKVTPWGFRDLLNYVKNTFNNPEIIIFENGYGDYGELNDTLRVQYFKEYFNAMLDAIDDGCNVTGYMIWTLMDNFEWRWGYTVRFGLYHVDFNDPLKTRTAKESAKFYRNVVKNHGVENGSANTT